MFWLVEPNFKDAARNLHIAGNVGILAYITVPDRNAHRPVDGTTSDELERRPLTNVNDPHLEKMLEPEHAH